MKNRTRLVLAATVLLLMHAAVLIGGFLAPYDPAQQNRGLPFAPPTRLHVIEASGTFHIRPFVYALIPVEGSISEYREDTTRTFPIQLLHLQRTGAMSGAEQSSHHLFGVEQPARIFLLGSDGYGTRPILPPAARRAHLSFRGIVRRRALAGRGNVVWSVGWFLRQKRG